MNKEEIIKEVISILETSDYVDPAEHLYDGLKQINREITDTTIHDFLWALESSAVIDVDGKVAECANKIKQLLQQELVGEAYENYKKEIIRQRELQKKHVETLRRQGKRLKVARIELLSKEEFIDKCKTDPEFSQKWGLTIEERELSRKERSEYYYKHGNSEGIVEGSLDRPIFEEDEVAHKWYDERNVPTKLITITYNDKTIESYEMDGKLCYCGNPVDTSNPDCVTFNLCKEHQMDA